MAPAAGIALSPRRPVDPVGRHLREHAWSRHWRERIVTADLTERPAAAEGEVVGLGRIRDPIESGEVGALLRQPRLVGAAGVTGDGRVAMVLHEDDNDRCVPVPMSGRYGSARRRCSRRWWRGGGGRSRACAPPARAAGAGRHQQAADGCHARPAIDVHNPQVLFLASLCPGPCPLDAVCSHGIHARPWGANTGR